MRVLSMIYRMKSYLLYLFKCMLILSVVITLSVVLRFYKELVREKVSESLFAEIVEGHLRQGDERIVNFIWKHQYILPPSDKPYALAYPNKYDPSMGQAALVQQILQNKKAGFFVECGALDGETRSNTLALERHFGWKGLLIEGDPKNYAELLKKHRRAWTAGCCLSIHPYPHKVWYAQDFNAGAIRTDSVHDEVKNRSLPVVPVQCFPLVSLLMALGVTEVDYLSLDVEGNEIDVLKTIDFDSIHIKVLSVEFSHGPGGADVLESFMREKKYRVMTKLTHHRSLANDLILVHESVPNPPNLNFPQTMKSYRI